MAGKSPRVRTTLTAALAAVALVLVLVPAASAGRGPGGKSGSSGLSLVTVIDANGNGLPNWGDTVTFSVSATATTTPEIGTACYRNGTEVYYHEGGFYAGDPWAPADQMFVLQSYYWTGGAADCAATRFYIDRKLQEVGLATLPFHIDV